MNVLKPRMPVPDFTVPVAGGGTWALSDQSPENFTMLVFYRGLHCPVCATYMKELQRMKQDFADRGVIVLGASSDTEERAQQAKDEWKLGVAKRQLELRSPQSSVSQGYSLCALIRRYTGLISVPCHLRVRISVRSQARLILQSQMTTQRVANWFNVIDFREVSDAI